MQKLASGVTVLTYIESDHHSSNVNCVVHIRYSNDGGATWSDRDKDLLGNAIANFPMYPPGGEPGTSELGPGEPHLMLCDNGDLLLNMWLVKYSTLVLGAYQSRSTDDGITWSTPALVEFIGLDEATNLRTFMTDDYFLFGGVIYSGARIYTDRFLTSCKSIFVKSTDDGATWEYVSDISSYSQPTEEVGLEYIGNSTILAILRADTNNKTYKSFSYDMGLTWSALEDVTAIFEASGRHRVYTEDHLKGGANWWADTRIIVVGFTLDTPGDSNNRTNCVWLSDTRGATWTQLDLDTTSEDGGYGDIIYNPTGGTFAVVSYRGTQAAANLEQYSFAINWN